MHAGAQKIELLEKRLYSHALHKDARLEGLYAQYAAKEQLGQDIAAVRRELKRSTTILQMDDLKCKKRVLRRLGYTSPADVIDIKGRVACEISSADELLLTDMIFNGVFNDLTVEQSVALLSCFVFQEKVCVATEASQP
jgi:ATP-dependent RNA helicase DOB1